MNTSEPEWMASATCRQYVRRRSTGEGEDWFSLKRERTARICRDECPVSSACAARLLKLMANPETYPCDGVWAGKPFRKDPRSDAA